VWALIASMYIGNVMLLILNLPLIKIFVKVIEVRPSILAASVLVLSTIGVYATNGRTFDLWFALSFGILGYLARRADFPAAPAILALVLERNMEDNFRRATTLSDGSLTIFLTRPLSVLILALCVLSLLSPYLQAWFAVRRGTKLLPLEGDDA
jgi:putative tricarboxylic transport membrane protein